LNKKLHFILIAVLCLSAHAVFADDGLAQIPSHFSVAQTADRLEKILTAKGMTIFNRINHAEAARKVGIEIRPTELFIFGNPKAGSPLMRCQLQAAIDLPQKMLVWEDESSAVWIAYNSPDYLKTRHNISDCEEALTRVETALAAISSKAASD
jgi:uncharacterized protein (DUF302 family)